MTETKNDEPVTAETSKGSNDIIEESVTTIGATKDDANEEKSNSEYSHTKNGDTIGENENDNETENENQNENEDLAASNDNIKNGIAALTDEQILKNLTMDDIKKIINEPMAHNNPKIPAV